MQDKSPPPLIGDYLPRLKTFDELDEVFKAFREESFQQLTKRKKFKLINQILLKKIQEAPEESFLLGAVVDYISRINRLALLPEKYDLTRFEFWLNHFADPQDKNDHYHLRGKLMGKRLPREEYQCFFPLGGAAFFPGTHFVAAHLSPDLDTLIASFWGWVDAFAAAVGTGQHVWCLPGGPPKTGLMNAFYEIFGAGFCEALARTSSRLSLTATDLVTQENFARCTGEVSISTIDHGINEKAIILIDDQDHYIGDWRSSDAELVRQVIVLFKSCLHWFENNLHISLITLFATEKLTKAQIPSFLSAIGEVAVGACEPALEFNELQRRDLALFFTEVLGIPQGLACTFGEMALALQEKGVDSLAQTLINLVATFIPLFDAKGELIEERTTLLLAMEKIIKELDSAIHSLRNYVERLDIAMQVKAKVVAEPPQRYITLESDVDEIKLKIQNYDYLTVVIQEENDALFPVGVVWARDLRKSILGTVSLRDFSNEEEMRMASYLAVISVIDHHKMTLKTATTPMAIISDVQSSNVLLAELTCRLNDLYSSGGLNLNAVNEQLAELEALPKTVSNARLTERLLKKKMIIEHGTGFIHPHREYTEYLTLLYGILDDTDLFNKVTGRDVLCVMHLLNRLKSLVSQRETEIVDFDDIKRDASFAKLAAKRILQQEDMYSIYEKLYRSRIAEIERELLLCSEGQPSDFFSDTKELNNCCRVGQTKLFASNIPCFLQHHRVLFAQWLALSSSVAASHSEIDLHMHMISTIPSADELREDSAPTYDHLDELWIWALPSRQGYAHLSGFLLAFQNAKEVKKNMTSALIFSPPDNHELEELFYRSFLRIPIAKDDHEAFWLKLNLGPWALLRFTAGSINSRKASISPYLPRLQ